MYCSKCQKNRKKGERYCEDCGTKLRFQITPMKISKKTYSIIIGFFLCVILLFSVYGIGLKLTSPSYIATKYLKALKSNDIDLIYSFLKEKEDIFYSKEVLEEKYKEMNIEDYKIISVENKGDSAIVLYEYMNGYQKNYAYVNLEKEKKNFSIYDTWKVDSAKIVENIKIKVLKDSTLTIDGKKVDKYRIKSEDEAYDVYQIPRMIKGEYHLEANLSNGLTMDKKIQVESNCTYILSYIELKETDKTKLGENVIDTLNKLYSSAISNKTYKQIKSQFKLSLEDIYDSLKANVQQYKIQSSKFSDPSIKKSYLNEEGNLVFVLTIDHWEKVKGKEDNCYNDIYLVEFEYLDSSFEIKDIVIREGR